MWKTLNAGEKVTMGDTIRYQPSSHNSSFKEKIYQVVKTEQHYFEIVVKPDNEKMIESLPRSIIRYMDIGYHLRVEVWMESAHTAALYNQNPA